MLTGIPPPDAPAAPTVHADALLRRGEALLAAHRAQEAAAVFGRALATDAGNVRAWVGLGSARLALAQFSRALRCMREALARNDGDIKALIGEGVALQRLGRTAEALARYEQVLQQQPNLAGLHHNRGMALRKLRRHDEAAEAFAQVAKLADDYPYAHGNLLRERLQTCDWRDYEALTRRTRELVAAGRPGDDPFSFMAYVDDPQEQFACARLYVQANVPPAACAAALPRTDNPDGRLRVAYVSCEFREHANALLTAGLFEAHDRSRFDITAISYGTTGDGPLQRRLRQGFDRFLDVREESDEAVVALMRDLGIQIAVDLRGLSSDCRSGIFARRAAPLQVGLIGFPGSTGAEFMDYVVVDRVVAPAGAERYFQEQLVRLPDCYLATDDRRERPGTALPRAAYGLPEGAFVFCCFNNSYKLNPAVFDLWMRLLQQLPNAVLWLLADNDSARRNLRHEAETRGVAGERLVFARRLSPSEHLARHAHADLFLDTFPYTAHTTASEALWCGLPLLTRQGGGFAARVASSLLLAADLPELVTRSPEEYEQSALQLARDPERLAALRRRLGEPRRLRLFDTGRYCRHLESAFAEMWRRHRAGEVPQGFDVPPSPA